MPDNKMKYSGNIWIGEIPLEWEVRKFKTVLSKNDGGIWGDDPNASNHSIVLRSTEQTVDGQWNIVNPALRDLKSITNLDYFRCLKGDLLITKSSGSEFHIGKTTLVDEKIEKLNCYYSNFLGRLRCNAFYEPKYYWYILNSAISREQFKLLKNSTIGLGNINSSDIGSLFVPIPSYETQKKIINFLDEISLQIDNAISKTKESIEDYKKLKESIISETVTKGLNPNVEMKNSGIEWIGDIPKHWKVVKLRFLGDISGGMSNKKPEDFGHGTPFVNYKSIYKNIVLPETFSELVNATQSDKEKYSVKYGDTLFTGSSETIDELGLSSTCLKDIPDATYNGFCMRFRPYSFDNYSPDYMKYYYRSSAIRNYLVAFDNSVTRTNLGQRKLKDANILLPPKHEQELIAKYIDDEFKKIDDCILLKEEIIDELDKYKRSLIYEYVTGKREAA